jgi:hypothetical protein
MTWQSSLSPCSAPPVVDSVSKKATSCLSMAARYWALMRFACRLPLHIQAAISRYEATKLAMPMYRNFRDRSRICEGTGEGGRVAVAYACATQHAAAPWRGRQQLLQGTPTCASNVAGLGEPNTSA